MFGKNAAQVGRLRGEEHLRGKLHTVVRARCCGTWLASLVGIEGHSVHILKKFVLFTQLVLQHLELRIDHTVLANQAIDLDASVGKMFSLW